jgi:hypothetical protein
MHKHNVTNYLKNSCKSAHERLSFISKALSPIPPKIIQKPEALKPVNQNAPSKPYDNKKSIQQTPKKRRESSSKMFNDCNLS